MRIPTLETLFCSYPDNDDDGLCVDFLTNE